MLRALPGVFVAGEMLDWEAPTGGYLITGCLATGLGPGATRRPGQAFDARSKDGRSRIRRVWARNGSVTGNFALIAQFMQWASRMSGIVSSVAHQVGAILGHAGQELLLRALELPAQAVLDLGDTHVLGQDEAVPRGHPEGGVELVDDGLRQAVLPRALQRAGCVGQRVVTVAEEGHDRDGIGDRNAVGDQHRHLAGGVEARDLVRPRRGGDVFVGRADFLQHPQDAHRAAAHRADDLVGFRHGCSPPASAPAPVRQHRQPDQRAFHHRHLRCRRWRSARPYRFPPASRSRSRARGGPSARPAVSADPGAGRRPGDVAPTGPPRPAGMAGGGVQRPEMAQRGDAERHGCDALRLQPRQDRADGPRRGLGGGVEDVVKLRLAVEGGDGLEVGGVTGLRRRVCRGRACRWSGGNPRRTAFGPAPPGRPSRRGPRRDPGAFSRSSISARPGGSS
jgi:hypothetical protein